MGALNRALETFEEVGKHEGNIKLDLLGLKQQPYAATVYVNESGSVGYVVVEGAEEQDQVIFCSRTSAGTTYTLPGTWDDATTVDDKTMVAVGTEDKLEDVFATHTEHAGDPLEDRDEIISVCKKAPQVTRDMAAQVSESAAPSIFSDLGKSEAPAFDLGSFKQKAKAFRRLTVELKPEKTPKNSEPENTAAESADEESGAD